MNKNLVIVESPAKAKTIEKFLGSDYTVKSSYGHIRDLKKKSFSINENTFEPEYEIPEDKEHVVSELRKLAKNAQTVWLASDEDREGEAISWHLKEVLGLSDETKRIVFHEITEPHPLAQSQARALCRTRAERSRAPRSGKGERSAGLQERKLLACGGTTANR